MEVMNRERRADESVDACFTRSPKTREVRWGRVGVIGGRTLGKESMKDRKVRVDVSLRLNDEELIIEPGSMSKMLNCDNSGSYFLEGWIGGGSLTSRSTTTGGVKPSQTAWMSVADQNHLIR